MVSIRSWGWTGVNGAGEAGFAVANAFGANAAAAVLITSKYRTVSDAWEVCCAYTTEPRATQMKSATRRQGLVEHRASESPRTWARIEPGKLQTGGKVGQLEGVQARRVNKIENPRRSAKPLYVSSILTRASNSCNDLAQKTLAF